MKYPFRREGPPNPWWEENSLEEIDSATRVGDIPDAVESAENQTALDDDTQHGAVRDEHLHHVCPHNCLHATLSHTKHWNQLSIIPHSDYPPSSLSAIKTIRTDFRNSQDSSPRSIIRHPRLSAKIFLVADNRELTVLKSSDRSNPSEPSNSIRPGWLSDWRNGFFGLSMNPIRKCFRLTRMIYNAGKTRGSRKNYRIQEKIKPLTNAV